MPPPPPRKPPTAPLPAEAIDALYGLEPVYEPQTGGSAGESAPAPGTVFMPLQCPFCGESFEILVDLSGGSAQYVEDCQVCCRPIELTLVLDSACELVTLDARRGD